MPAFPMVSVSPRHPAQGAAPAALPPRLAHARAVATARRTSAYVARRPAARKAKARNSVAVLRKRLREAWRATVTAVRTWQAATLAALVIATATGVWVWPSVLMVKRSAATPSPSAAISQKEDKQPASSLYPVQKEDALQLKLSARISSSSTDHTGESK